MERIFKFQLCGNKKLRTEDDSIVIDYSDGFEVCIRGREYSISKDIGPYFIILENKKYREYLTKVDDVTYRYDNCVFKIEKDAVTFYNVNSGTAEGTYTVVTSKCKGNVIAVPDGVEVRMDSERNMEMSVILATFLFLTFICGDYDGTTEASPLPVKAF